MAKVLIIDDDRNVCLTMASLVQHTGHEPVTACSLEEGLQKVYAQDFDVVFLDVCLPDGNGLEALPDIRRSVSEPEVIIMTGASDPEGAEQAIESGAWDYISKPAAIEVMTLPLIRALQYRKGRQENRPPVILKREAIIGNSPPMKESLAQLAQAAASDVDVLISGETGTGKEIFAQAIHNNSTRAAGNFVVVDCAALPESLVESVLFGHEKGAFTGAEKASEGLIKQANGGTLFLDEVGELPLSMQKSFLRVLQERRYRPVGARQEMASDFRVIAATNRNLDDMVNTGRFRSDLLFRLRSFTIHLPPVRERREDIRDLVMHQITKICSREGKRIKGVSPEFMEMLEVYKWPGNIRELFQTVEMVLATAHNEPILFPMHLPTWIRIKVTRATINPQVTDRQATPGLDTAAALPSLKEFRQAILAETETRYLRRLMTLTNGKIDEACRISGIARARLYELLKTHNLSAKS